MKNIAFSLVAFLVSGGLAHAVASDGKSPLLAKAVECTDRGTLFKLVRQPDQTYNLEYGGSFKIGFEGWYKVQPLTISKGLNCRTDSGALGAITCTANEDQIVDIPKAGKNDLKVSRESTVWIGMKWHNIVAFDPAYNGPEKNLGMNAEFQVALHLGEVLNKIQVEGAHAVTGEKMELNIDATLIDLAIDGSEQSQCTMKL